jgi:ATP-dependent helicase HrpB
MSLKEQRQPEILEADLAPMLLELSQWGVRDVNELSWITSPPPGAVSQALELLINLEAVDENRTITARGRKMLTLPTHPRIAHMMLVAEEDSTKALALATDLAAIMEERDPVAREEGADISIRLEALRKWRAGEKMYADRNVLEKIEKLAANWRRVMRVALDNAIPPDNMAGKILWAAYPERLARQQEKHGTRFKLANGRIVALAEHDPLMREPWLCVALLDAGKKEGKIFLAAPVHIDDIMDHSREEVTVRWDSDREMVISCREKKIGPLILESRPHTGSVSLEVRLPVIAQQIRQSELRIVGDPEARTTFQARVISLHHWRKEEGWPAITDEYLLEHLEIWLAPFLGNITKKAELGKLDIVEVLKSLLPWELQNKLDVLAPTKLQVPSGSMIKVSYSIHGEPPFIEVRLQEMFGLTDTPTVNEGRTTVKLHLLSPGYKPVQVTQDLRSFWATTYHDVRKELRMRYPRHHWPEDPWTAEAVRGAKRRSR